MKQRFWIVAGALVVLSAAAWAGPTAMNESRDFAGDNLETAIYLHWSDVPEGTARLVISRADLPEGPWRQVADLAETPETPSSYADTVDGERQDWFYRLEAFSAAGQLLRSYPVLWVPASPDN